MQEKRVINYEQIGVMSEKPEIIKQATNFLLIIKYLECIANHVTNMGERIIYMETEKSKD